MTTLFLVLFVWPVLAIVYLGRKQFAAAIYLLVLVAFPSYWTPIYLPTFNLLSIQHIVAFGIAIGLVLESSDQLVKRTLDYRRLSCDGLVAVVVVIWSLSRFGAGTLTGGFRDMVYNLLDFWFPFSLALRIVVDSDQIKRLSKWVVWPAVGLAGLTLVEIIQQRPIAFEWFSSIYSAPYEDVWAPTMRAGILRVQATMAQPIFLGFHLATAGLLAFLLGVQESNRKRLLYFLTSGFLLGSSLLPMARGSAIAVAVAIVVMTLMLRGRSRWRLIVAVLLAAGAIWLGTSYFGVATSFWTDFLDTLAGRSAGPAQSYQLENYIYRQYVVVKGLDLIARAPLLGYGDVSVGGTWPIPDVANVFIQVGLVSGPVGLALAIALWFAMFFFLRVLLRRERGQGQRELVIGLLAAILIVLLSWTDSSWPGQYTQIGWMLFGVVVSWALTKPSASSVLVTSNVPERANPSAILSRRQG